MRDFDPVKIRPQPKMANPIPAQAEPVGARAGQWPQGVTGIAPFFDKLRIGGIRRGQGEQGQAWLRERSANKVTLQVDRLTVSLAQNVTLSPKGRSHGLVKG